MDYGDVKVKNLLYNILNEELSVYKKRREELEKNIPALKEELKLASEEAREVVKKQIEEVRKAIGIKYF